MIGIQTSRRYFARAALAVVLVVASGTFGLRGPSATPTADALALPLNAGGEYHAIAPVRILDTGTRALDVEPFGNKPTGLTPSEFTFPALGKGELPGFVDANSDKLDDEVLALAVNITIDQGTSGGYAQLYAAGVSTEASLANFSPRETIPNFAIVRPGAAGKLAAKIITTEPGSARVIVDVFGYFTTSNSQNRGARIVTTTPGRIFDSRKPEVFPAAKGALAGGSQMGLQIRGAITDKGRTAVPDDENVTGVIVNLTGVNNVENRSTGTYLSMLPTPLAANKEPATSNLNLIPNDIKAATGIVPVGPDGKIYIYQKAGAADVVVDVLGYLIDGKPVGSTTGRLVPLVEPFRAADTRQPQHGNRKEGPGIAEDWSFEKFIKDVKINGQWVGNQQGFIANFTATGLDRQYPTVPVGSYLTVSPPPANGVNRVPETSNVNLGERQTIPNMLVARFGPNSADARCSSAQCLRVYNEAGYVDYVFDVSAVILA